MCLLSWFWFGGKKSATEKEVGGIFSSSPFFSFFHFCGLRRENHPHGLTLTFDENIPRRAVFLFTSVRVFTGTILLIFCCFSIFCLPISHFTFLPGDRHMGEKEVQDDLQRANSRKTMVSIHSEAPLFTPLTSSAGFADVLRFCMRNGCKSPEDSPIFTRQTKACLICKHLTGSARIYAPLGSARSVVCFSALD